MDALDRFTNKIKSGGRVLYFGYDNALDNKVLREKGYDVILCNDIVNNELGDSFDGIWARISLINAEKKSISTFFYRFKNLLKPGGCIYISLRYGNSDCYTCFTEDSFMKWIDTVTGLSIEEIWADYDSRPCSNDRWLNVILKK